jgi:hypothetical protein
MKKIVAIFVCLLMTATVFGMASSDVIGKKPPKPPGGDDPPANPAIAYNDINRGHIAVINADGSNKGVIVETYTENDEVKRPYQASWSPDGTQITYLLWETSMQNRYSICIVDVDIVDGKPQGSNHQRIVTDTWRNWDGPVWSPAGDDIAFVAQIPKNSPFILWSVDADGTGGPTALYTADQGTDIRWPSWNHDGTKIAFIEKSPASGGGYEYSIRVYDLATRLTTTEYGPTTEYSIVYGFDWSNDGNKFAFILYPSPDGENMNALCTFDIATDTLTLVAGTRDYGGLSWGISWSPDDSEIAFSSYPGARGKHNLMSIDLSTDKSTMLVKNTAYLPDWRRPTDTWP